MPRNKNFNEEEVLDKAVELFWRKGFHATSMQDVVETLGINRASIYDTFGDKESLYNKAIKRYIENNTILTNKFLEFQPSVKQGILNFFMLMIDSSVNDADRKGCFTVNAITELSQFNDSVCEILTRNKDNFEDLFTQFIQKGIEKGEMSISLNVPVIATYLVTLFNGLKVVAKIEPDRAKLENTVKIGLQVLTN